MDLDGGSGSLRDLSSAGSELSIDMISTRLGGGSETGGSRALGGSGVMFC